MKMRYEAVRLLGALAIAAAALVTYQPGIRIGFFNGWWYLQWVGTLDLPRYLSQFLDPRNVTQGYRPVQGLYVLVQYWLFHFNADGYLVTHMLLHAANAVFFFLIVARLGQRWRLALVAALLYVVSPVYALAVFWHAVVDPLSVFFYLLTILLWTVYQEHRRPFFWGATFIAFLLALFSKEVAVFLPFLLFLIERWFYHRRPGARALVLQYAPFLLVYVPYVLLELNVQSHGEFVGQFKFSVGPHMLGNLLPYLAVLAFPWTANLPAGIVPYVWLAVVLVVYIGVMLYKRSTLLFFLGAVAVLNIVPLLGFPLDYFNTRYLYTSTMVPAVLVAVLVELALQVFGTRRAVGWGLALVVGVVVIASSARVSEAASGLAEFTRGLRVPFRDISRAHPSFPADTYLYFVDSPHTPLGDFQGLFFTRYGTGVQVDGIEAGHFPKLRQHAAAFVYYFDSTGRPVEIAVEKDNPLRASRSLPVRFDGPILLENADVASATLSRGKALVVFLTWSTAATPDKNYTVFVHLLDSNGSIVASHDTMPRRGEMPTGTWVRGRPVVDAIVVPVAPDAPPGRNFRLELGLYDAATDRRISILDANGAPSAGALVFEPFTIAQ